VTLAGRPLHESGIRLSAAVAWKRPVLVNLPACHAIWACSGSLEMGLYFLGPWKARDAIYFCGSDPTGEPRRLPLPHQLRQRRGPLPLRRPFAAKGSMIP
jgi:hypothetical protein